MTYVVVVGYLLVPCIIFCFGTCRLNRPTGIFPVKYCVWIVCDPEIELFIIWLCVIEYFVDPLLYVAHYTLHIQFQARTTDFLSRLLDTALATAYKPLILPANINIRYCGTRLLLKEQEIPIASMITVRLMNIDSL